MGGRESSHHCSRDLEQAFGILVGELVAYIRGELEAVEKRAAQLVAAVRVVDGEEDPVRSEHLESEFQWRHCKEAACGDVDIALKIGAGLLAQVLGHSAESA